MVLKSITSKIQPISLNEKCFYEAISKTKSIELDPRSLTFFFLNENTLYPEAASLAKAAVSWAEELEANYARFESKATFITKCDEKSFQDYCSKKKWAVKRNSKDLIARDEMKFKARFELDSNSIYMILEDTEPLKLIQILNELGDE